VIVPIRLVLGQHRATRLALAGVEEGGRPQPQHRADPASDQPPADAAVGPVAGSLQPLDELAGGPLVPGFAPAQKKGDGSRRLPV
jgi:hypothetical protein